MPFHSLSSLTPQPLIPGFIGRMIHSESMTFSEWTIEKGSKLPEHSPPDEQTEYQVVIPGMIVIIPSDVLHSGVALEDCKIIDIFCPVREDYRVS